MKGNNMKRSFRKVRQLTLVTLILVMMAMPISGATISPAVHLNGVELAFDSPPYIVDGRTMVPVRAITEALGAQVDWDGETEIITISIFETTTLYLKIGISAYVINGNSYVMDAAPEIREGRTMVPLRFVAEGLGCDVIWHEATSSVELTKEGFVVSEAFAVNKDYTDEDLLWLARIVNVEGLDIGYEAKLAIANVVINRAKGDEYPDTVYKVIMDNDYAIQFPPAHRSSFQSLEPDEQSWLVAEDALKGNNNIDDCLYFNNRPFKSKADDLYKVIEGEYFYR